MVQCESFVLFVIQYKKQYVMGTDIENAVWCFYSNGTEVDEEWKGLQVVSSQRLSQSIPVYSWLTKCFIAPFSESSRTLVVSVSSLSRSFAYTPILSCK